MRDKYLILYKGNETRLQTKQQIQDLFTIPLYIVNKAIKKRDNVNSHNIYKDFINDVQISLIKPEITL